MTSPRLRGSRPRRSRPRPRGAGSSPHVPSAATAGRSSCRLFPLPKPPRAPPGPSPRHRPIRAPHLDDGRHRGEAVPRAAASTWPPSSTPSPGSPSSSRASTATPDARRHGRSSHRCAAFGQAQVPHHRPGRSSSRAPSGSRRAGSAPNTASPLNDSILATPPAWSVSGGLSRRRPASTAPSNSPSTREDLERRLESRSPLLHPASGPTRASVEPRPPRPSSASTPAHHAAVEPPREEDRARAPAQAPLRDRLPRSGQCVVSHPEAAPRSPVRRQPASNRARPCAG